MFKLLLLLPFIYGQTYNSFTVQEDVVPILGYHRIVETEEEIDSPHLELTQERYEAQIRYLNDDYGCNWLTMDRLSTYIVNKEKLPTKTCVITFDDGDMSQYTLGLHILDELSIPVTYYIITERVNNNRFYMNSIQLEYLHQRGHEIGSHTITHPHLDLLEYSTAFEEINGSKLFLESKGFTITSLAYPYGDSSELVYEIMEETGYVLGRAIAKGSSHSDPRAITISDNDDYLNQFHYLKPEHRTPIELFNYIKYNGWWQVEEQYKILNGEATGTSSNLPTNSSFQNVKLKNLNDKIQSMFLIKNAGNFSIEIVIGGETHFTKVSIDNGEGILLYNEQCEEYLHNFCSYNVDVELLSGVHTIEFENNHGSNIFIDKFRIFSDTNQDFTDTSLQYTVPEPEIPDQFCENGIIYFDTCCLNSCGVCGDSINCSDNDGGELGCCTETISNLGRSCDDVSAPCTMSEPEQGIPDPLCENGIITGDICCLDTCGTCGGDNCSSREGGDWCCTGTISNLERSCNNASAPCNISPPPPPPPGPPDPLCENGIISNGLCCLSSCGTCGGDGCASRIGGGTGCCTGSISVSEKSCNNTSAPCIISLF